MTGFYDVGALGEVAITLFHGCGYTFYREENQLRADDQKVRTLVSELLAGARKAVSTAEAEFRRDRLSAPTRDNPFPSSDVVADAKLLEALGKAIGAVEGQVRHAPVPENDRMTQRYREEAATLLALIEQDKLLVGRAQTLRQAATGRTAEEILASRDDIEEGVAAIVESLAARRLLTI